MRHLTDEYGSVTARMAYDPYGVPLQPNTASSLGFTGELTDPLGLVYLRARTYNPTLGIFTSRDPVLGIAGLSASYNGYGYVHGNPTNYRDPSGECPDGLGLFQCVAYDALDALNRVSITARQIIGIGAYVTATEVSPRAAAVGDWVLEHSGTYDLLDDLSFIARHIDRDLLGNASQGTIQRGDMRRALQTILTQPYQSSAAFSQVRGDLEPSGWLVSLATLLYGVRGVVNSITPTLRAMPQLSTSGQLVLALQASVTIEAAAAVALIPAYMGARRLGGDILQMSDTFRNPREHPPVDYDDSFDLAAEARRFRRENQMVDGDVAVFEYLKEDGSLGRITVRNRPSGLHAERRAAEELRRQGIRPEQVTRIYSELRPCTIQKYGANCARFIAQNFPQADVYYSYKYPMDRPTRQRWYEDIGRLLGED